MTVKLLNTMDIPSLFPPRVCCDHVSPVVYWALRDILAAVLAQRLSHQFNINIGLMMKTLCNLLLRGDTPRVYCRGGEQQELWRRFTSPRIEKQDSQTWLCSTVMFIYLPNENFKWSIGDCWPSATEWKQIHVLKYSLIFHSIWKLV